MDRTSEAKWQGNLVAEGRRTNLGGGVQARDGRQRGRSWSFGESKIFTETTSKYLGVPIPCSVGHRHDVLPLEDSYCDKPVYSS
jgi:hypothetical protein